MKFEDDLWDGEETEYMYKFDPISVSGYETTDGDFEIIVGKEETVLTRHIGFDAQVRIPSDVDVIADGAFDSNAWVQTLYIPKSVKKIGCDIVCGCEKLKRIVYDGMLSDWCKIEFGENPLDDGVQLCIDGAPVENPVFENIEEIPENAFYLCKSIKSVTVGGGVKKIGERAFGMCADLERVCIGEDVAQIGESAFEGCHVAEFTVSEKNPHYRSETGCLVETAQMCVVAGCDKSVIPQGIKKIGNGAFTDCLFTELAIPDSVTEIEALAFSGCGKLKEIVLPPSLAEIGDGAFEFCESLGSVNIPASVERIGDAAFCKCASLSQIKVAAGNKAFYDEGNCLIKRDGNVLIAGCRESDIPSAVTEIADSVFYETELNRIRLPRSLRRVGSFAFFSAPLREITFPASLEKIESFAFRKCEKLEHIIFEGAPKFDLAYAFDGCVNLRTVTAPKAHKKYFKEIFGKDAFGERKIKLELVK